MKTLEYLKRTISKALMIFLVSLPLLIWGAFLWGLNFPMGDGGLWFVMSRDIINNHGWPLTNLKFNGEILPLGYPPLAAYLLIGVEVITKIEPLILMVWLPYIMNLLSLLPFYHFTRNYFLNTKDSKIAVFATASYAVILATCNNFFSGGALPRSLGLNFLLLAWWSVSRSTFTERQLYLKVFAISVFLAGAGLSHPTAALWSIAGVILLSVFDRRLSNRHLLGGLFLAALICLPWIILVLSKNEIEIFIKAFSVGSGEMWGWRRFGQPQELLIPGGFLGALGVLGIIFLIKERMLVMPLLMLMGLLIDRRGLFVLHGVCVAAVALGYGVMRLVGYLRESHCSISISTNNDRNNQASTYHGVGTVILSLVILSVLVVDQVIFIGDRFFDPKHDLKVDSLEEYQAIIRGFKSDERVSLLAGRWESINGEWLSALSNIRIYPLPQAQEWTGNYAQQIEVFNKIAKCCLVGGWGCLRENKLADELSKGEILVDLSTCSSVLQDYHGQVDLERIKNFAVLNVNKAGTD